MLRLAFAGLLSAVVVAGTAFEERQPYTTWSAYAGSADSMQYSALAQINRTTVGSLERAWFYPVIGAPERLPFNPLIVDDVMYVAGEKGVVVALNAATGAEVWRSAQQATERRRSATNAARISA